MKTLIAVGVCVALLAVPGTADAQGMWDLATDFSTTTNDDTSTWSYRKGPRDTHTVLPNFGDFGPFTPGPKQGGWGGGAEDWSNPYLIWNNTPFVQNWYGSVPDIPAGSVFGTPAGDSELIASWLSPITGQVDISAEIVFRQDHGPGSNGIDYHIDLNNSAGNLLTGSLGDATSLAGTTTGPLGVSGQSVSAGNRINLVMDSQGTGAYDVLGVALTITQVPEPATLAMLATLLGVCLLGMRAPRPL